MSNIKEILSKYKSIAMIGVSNDPTKASTIVMKYMQKYGFKVFPVNPKAKGQKILGEEVYEKITEAAGAKLIEMMTLRGAYDFIAIVEGSNFETAAGMKMLMEATGTIKDMTIMESVDFNKAAEIASKAAASYRPVGK